MEKIETTNDYYSDDTEYYGYGYNQYYGYDTPYTYNADTYKSDDEDVICDPDFCPTIIEEPPITIWVTIPQMFSDEEYSDGEDYCIEYLEMDNQSINK